MTTFFPSKLGAFRHDFGRIRQALWDQWPIIMLGQPLKPIRTKNAQTHAMPNGDSNAYF